MAFFDREVARVLGAVVELDRGRRDVARGTALVAAANDCC
jgi:hypothetical protein